MTMKVPVLLHGMGHGCKYLVLSALRMLNIVNGGRGSVHACSQLCRARQSM